MASDDFLAKYAELLIGTCLGISKGTRLRIRCEAPHRGLARLIAIAAWKRGAREVMVQYADPLLDRAAIESMNDGWLDDISKFTRDEYSRFADEGWAYLRIQGEEDLEALEGLESSRLQRWDRTRSIEVLPFLHAMAAFTVPWCTAPAPTEAWARWVFTTSGWTMPDDPVAALWETFLPILRLDRPDPAAAWLADVMNLGARAELMTQHRFDSLHFYGPGTDLRVGLSPSSLWKNAIGTTHEGKRFTPNLPSEEIFSTPDARRTSGRVTVTRPVRVMGVMVENAWFRFEKGEVVESSATRNAEALACCLASETGMRRLGEVALVECDSPVAKSKLIFGNILLDENAACHIALGLGIEETFENVQAMDGPAREAAGFNEAIDHLDFMIGSDKIDVDGFESSNRITAVMRAGKFVLA